MDRSDPNFEVREKLLTKNQQIMSSLTTVDEKYVIKYVQMVKNTYTTGQKYMYRMSIPLVTLAAFYRVHGEIRKAGDTFMLIFQMLKECDRMFSSMVLIQAINSFIQAGLKREARDTLKLAKEYFVGSVDYYNYAYDINDFRLP